MHQPVERLGRELAGLLLAVLAEPGLERRHVLPTHLVVRGSA